MPYHLGDEDSHLLTSLLLQCFIFVLFCGFLIRFGLFFLSL